MSKENPMSKKFIEKAMKQIAPDMKKLIEKKNRINQETGRVYIQNKYVGFGILDKETEIIHVTHDTNGILMEERMTLKD